MRTPDSEDVEGGGGSGSLADGYGTVDDGDDTGFGEGAGDETRAVEGDQDLRPGADAETGSGDPAAEGIDDGGGDGLDFDGDGDVDFDDLQELVEDLFDFGDDDGSAATGDPAADVDGGHGAGAGDDVAARTDDAGLFGG